MTIHTIFHYYVILIMITGTQSLPLVNLGCRIVLREIMSYCKHVIRDCTIMGGYVLQKNLSHWKILLVCHGPFVV